MEDTNYALEIADKERLSIILQSSIVNKKMKNLVKDYSLINLFEAINY